MRYLSLALILALASCGEAQPEQAEPTPAQVEPEPAPITHECVEFGDGNRPGDKIGNAAFQNCLGERVELQSTCGDYPLKVIAVSTVWCPACKSYLRSLTYDHQISRAGWDYMIIVAQNAERENDVTLEQCMAYAEEIDADPAKVVIDPGFRMSLAGGLIDNCGDGNISLPFMAILDGWDHTYEYSQGCGGSAANGYTTWRDAFLGEIYEE